MAERRIWRRSISCELSSLNSSSLARSRACGSGMTLSMILEMGAISESSSGIGHSCEALLIAEV
jgi:hypothetical protein